MANFTAVEYLTWDEYVTALEAIATTATIHTYAYPKGNRIAYVIVKPGA